LENREWFDDIGREWLTRLLPKGKSGSQRRPAMRWQPAVTPTKETNQKFGIRNERSLRHLYLEEQISPTRPSALVPGRLSAKSDGRRFAGNPLEAKIA
jgi:hypothetical protein